MHPVTMASASSFRTTSSAVQCLSSAHSQRVLGAQLSFNTLILPRQPLSRSILVFSRRRNSNSELTAASSSSKKKKKKNQTHNDAKEGADEEDDAFEALFRQLDEDLKNDDLPLDDSDDEISEEDLAMLERELEDALGEDDTEILSSAVDNAESSNDTKEDDDKEDEKPVKLRNWQLRRLATALKSGRRKTSIKSLAAEVCLDRGVVLELLREPPPALLMMSLALPDEPAPTVLVPKTKPLEIIDKETSVDPSEDGTKAKVPVHVMQHRWSAQKRLKKVQVDTLERVYKRTRRPTNSMISSIVQVTNLPRRRVVKWFEDKRAEDGVPLNRLPYQRSIPETV